jgi:hypothetical protein
MQVISKQVNEGENIYALDNGCRLRVVRPGARNQYIEYVYPDDRTYGARTGRFSSMTLTPAIFAMNRFEGASKVSA